MEGARVCPDPHYDAPISMRRVFFRASGWLIRLGDESLAKADMRLDERNRRYRADKHLFEYAGATPRRCLG